MGQEIATGSRVTIIDDEIDGFRIEIATDPELWTTRIAIGVWLLFWVIGEFFALSYLLSGRGLPKGGGVFSFPESILWLIGWTIGGVAAGCYLAWFWIGRELVYLRGDELIVHCELYGWGPRQRFDIARVRDFRYDSLPGGKWGLTPKALKTYRSFGGTVAFDYDGRTEYLGLLLPKADAILVIDVLATKIKGRKPLPG